MHTHAHTNTHARACAHKQARTYTHACTRRLIQHALNQAPSAQVTCPGVTSPSASWSVGDTLQVLLRKRQSLQEATTKQCWVTLTSIRRLLLSVIRGVFPNKTVCFYTTT